MICTDDVRCDWCGKVEDEDTKVEYPEGWDTRAAQAKLCPICRERDDRQTTLGRAEVSHDLECLLVGMINDIAELKLKQRDGK